MVNKNNIKSFLGLYELNYQHGLEKYLPLIDLAHLKALKKNKSIPLKNFKRLNSFFLKEIKNGYKPKNYIADDIYQNRNFILNKILKDNYKYIHVGRARRDVINTALSLSTRDNLIQLIKVINDLSYQILKTSKLQRKTIFPDFTYNQKAQPNYLSHYLLSFIFPQIRTLNNLIRSLDKCLMYHGSIGALNGTSLNIDRKMVARNLKYNDLIINTRDAMWPIDIYLEISSGMTNYLVILERLINDLIFFNSYNNSYIKLDEKTVRNSVIMPQKRNPFTLNMSKACIKELINFNSLIISSNLSQSGQVESRTHVYNLPNKIKLAISLIKSFKQIFMGIKFQKNNMLADANDISLYSTEITDKITKITKLPNRDVYNIVKKVINNNEKYKLEKALSKELRTYNNRININKVLFEIRKINSQEILLNRKTIGGGSLKSIDTMIKKCSDEIKKNKKIHLKFKKFLIYR